VNELFDQLLATVVVAATAATAVVTTATVATAAIVTSTAASATRTAGATAFRRNTGIGTSGCRWSVWIARLGLRFDLVSHA
jgi:hypothetical protein